MRQKRPSLCASIPAQNSSKRQSRNARDPCICVSSVLSVSKLFAFSGSICLPHKRIYVEGFAELVMLRPCRFTKDASVCVLSRIGVVRIRLILAARSKSSTRSCLRTGSCYLQGILCWLVTFRRFGVSFNNKLNTSI